jgi:hypothetical protein
MGDEVGNQRGVIPKDAVRCIAHPAMVDGASADAATGKGPIVVVPLMDGDRVAGLEIRCGCGASVVVECVYEETKS